MERKRLADMMVVDTSALLAILFGEPERGSFWTVLDKTDRVMMSAGTLIEARMVARARSGDPMVIILDNLIQETGIKIVDVTEEQAKIAHHAFAQYGKGSGHPAQLNFGDLFSYALAKSQNVPLLFKGDDFAQTDLQAAV